MNEMYYFLRGRTLIAHEDKNGVRAPLKIKDHLEAMDFVRNLNRNHPDKVAQYFFSPTDIVLNENEVESDD